MIFESFAAHQSMAKPNRLAAHSTALRARPVLRRSAKLSSIAPGDWAVDAEWGAATEEEAPVSGEAAEWVAASVSDESLALE